MKTVYTTKILHFDFSGLKQIPKKLLRFYFALLSTNFGTRSVKCTFQCKR